MCLEPAQLSARADPINWADGPDKNSRPGPGRPGLGASTDWPSAGIRRNQTTPGAGLSIWHAGEVTMTAAKRCRIRRSGSDHLWSLGRAATRSYQLARPLSRNLRRPAMKRTVDGSFTQLDENLNLDPFVRRKAQNIHNTIREDLKKARIIASSFLQGSFTTRRC